MSTQFGVLTFKQRTVLKPGTNQSVTYNSEEVKVVESGYRLFIKSYRPSSDPNHYEIELGTGAYPEEWLETFHSSKRETWYVFKPHIQDVEGLNPANRPMDFGQSPLPITKDRGILIKTQGREIWSNDPITKSTPNFTWREALHVQPTGRYRNPASQKVLERIEVIAQAIQQIRERYNRPVQINSWYRDPATNARVGGASASRHLSGDAIDFVVSGLSTRQVFNELNPWWGSRGGLAFHPFFVHIDARGWEARWNY